MITLHYRKKTVDIAQEWSELTRDQYIKIAGLLHSGLSDDEKLVETFRILSDKGMLLFLLMDKEFIFRSLEHIKWVFEKQDVTVQLIPAYKGFHGPASEFDNLVGQEFHHTEMAYQEIIADDAQALDRLVAFMYRPMKKGYNLKINKDGDARVPFNYHECIYRAYEIQHWPLNVKQAVLMWYAGCRQLLVKCYPLAFNGKKKESNYSDGMFGTMRSIAEGGKYGDFEKVENMPIHTMFREIVECKKEEIEMEKQINKPQ